VKYDPDKHKRRSIRLKGHDYPAAGMYFITLCTYRRECLFGEIADGIMQLNPLGKIVADEWLRSSEIRQKIGFDAWVIMPNHLHGIVVIETTAELSGGVGANGRLPLRGVAPSMKPRSLSSLVAGFKSATTKRINIHRNAPGNPVWQRNYYEHIIRNNPSLQTIQTYIHNNPQSWPTDQLYPNNSSKW
jgi:putative transposase